MDASNSNVFISNHSPKLKKTFVSHLFRRLLGHGLQMYPDLRELQGEGNLTSEIKEVIGKCAVHIVIFANDYAGSSRYLDELVYMLESGSTVIPVFYDVEVSAIRWTETTEGDVEVSARVGIWEKFHPLKMTVSTIYTHVLQVALFFMKFCKKCRQYLTGKMVHDGHFARQIPAVVSALRPTETTKRVYAEALKTLESSFDAKLILKWRKALYDAAGKSGFELKAYNGEEGRLVDKIVKRVMKKLEHHLYYDVFINHRGPDVKKKLASQLYHCLHAHGFRVFLDTEELQKGHTMTSQIERAIETASVHIVIFSKNYAQSTWCLMELDLMLKSKSKPTILPIFYDVKPIDIRVRNYDNCFKELRKQKLHNYETHEEHRRYDPRDIKNWRKAVSDVSDVFKRRSFDMQRYDSDEGKLVRDLVQQVLKSQMLHKSEGGPGGALRVGFSPVYSPMENEATGFLITFALIAAVVGGHHLPNWTAESLASSVASTMTACALLFSPWG